MRKFIIGISLLTSLTFLPALASADLLSDLQAQVQQLLAQIKVLQQQQSGDGQQWCHTFNTDLTFGSSGAEVSALNQALSFTNLTLNDNVDNSVFNENTAADVVQFQAKYGIRQTGYVGPITRAKLNSLYGCGGGIPASGITVNYPQPNQSITSPLKITGYVNGNGWTGFEGQVGTVSLIDGSGAVLGSAILNATTDSYKLPTSFEANLSFNYEKSGNAKLVFHNENAKGSDGVDGVSDNNKQFTVPVYLPEVVSSATFSASPSSGNAPLRVVFRAGVDWSSGLSVNFGDGTSGALQNNCRPGLGACGQPTAEHTYSTAGTYTATLHQPYTCNARSVDGGVCGGAIIGQVTITVTSGISQSLTVLSPNGGETWTKGTTQAIKWQDNIPTPICPVGAQCSPLVLPRYDIQLAPYYTPCAKNNPCPMSSYAYRAPYTIGKGLSGGNFYNWSVGTYTLGDYSTDWAPDGQYTIQVCQSGTSNCDSSDSYFKIVSGSTLPTLSVSVDQSTPPSTTLSNGQANVDVAHIALSASGGDVLLNQISVGINPATSANLVSNIKIYDGATLLGSIQSLPNRDVSAQDYQWGSINISTITIPSNGRKILTLKTDIAQTGRGFFRAGVVGLTYSDTVPYSTGTFNGFGNQMTVGGTTSSVCPLTAKVTSTNFAENNTTWGFDILVNATNAKMSDGWTANFQGYVPEVTPYGVVKHYGNFFLSSGPLMFTAQDKVDNSCSTTITVYPPVSPSSVVTISSLSPSSGSVGTQVSIIGTGFDVFQNPTTVYFNGSSVSYSVGTAESGVGPRTTWLSFTVPSSIGGYCPTDPRMGMMCSEGTPVTSGAYNVSVQNANGTSNSVPFTVTSGTSGGVPSTRLQSSATTAYANLASSLTAIQNILNNWNSSPATPARLY